ncbi:hypothetical protein MRB53_037494 [Persea americana]|nr:hypothetical protein MRB53_037494 [Persea americana]
MTTYHQPQGQAYSTATRRKVSTAAAAAIPATASAPISGRTPVHTDSRHAGRIPFVPRPAAQGYNYDHRPSLSPSPSPGPENGHGHGHSQHHSHGNGNGKPHKHHHHHHHHSSSDKKRSSTTVDTFLGAGAGGLIGDMIFPGLGYCGRAHCWVATVDTKWGDAKRRTWRRGVEAGVEGRDGSHGRS